MLVKIMRDSLKVLAWSMASKNTPTMNKLFIDNL